MGSWLYCGGNSLKLDEHEKPLVQSEDTKLWKQELAALTSIKILSTFERFHFVPLLNNTIHSQYVLFFLIANILYRCNIEIYSCVKFRIKLSNFLTSISWRKRSDSYTDFLKSVYTIVIITVAILIFRNKISEIDKTASAPWLIVMISLVGNNMIFENAWSVAFSVSYYTVGVKEQLPLKNVTVHRIV